MPDIRFDQRDFAKPLPTPPYVFTIENMTWSLEWGGPEEATFRADGTQAALMNLPQLLRMPVRVTDQVGAAMWWGFVNEVEIHLGGLVYTASLEGFANSIAVEWRNEAPMGGSAAADSWDTRSSFLDDVNSQRLYGVRQSVFNIGEARQGDAEAARATYLEKMKLPLTKSTPGEALERPFGILKMRGWFETLSWKRFGTGRGYAGNVERASGGVDYPFANAAGNHLVAQKFLAYGTSAWTARFVWLKIYQVGAPADNMTCAIYNSAFTTLLASATVAGSAFKHDSADWYIFDLGAGCSLTPGQYYYVRLARSGAVDAANYYGVKVEEDAILGASLFYYWNGSTYVARAPSASAIMAVYGEEETTAQISNIEASAGQFIEGTVIKDLAGVATRMFRNSKQDALTQVKDLLVIGTSAGEKMDAWVNPERWLVIRKRPAASDPTLLVTTTGEVKYRTGRVLIGSDIPVGRWARIESLMQMGGDYGAQSTVFLTRAEWKDGKVKVWWD